ncbi:MAG: GNAT family N-acetyltransferase [Oscillospiraceae bacterium]|nr:GNAT family N-acetyltransferase [Oscillospiraceae bacterium]
MIRRAELSDLERLAELFRQLHVHHINIAPDSHKMPFEGYFALEMRSFLEDEDITVLVEELDGVITAYAVLRIYDRERAERVHSRICYVEHFSVAEDMRGQGSGTRLFEGVKHFAQENNCDRIQLGAAAANDSAVRFYSKQGMTPRTIKMELKL